MVRIIGYLGVPRSTCQGTEMFTALPSIPPQGNAMKLIVKAQGKDEATSNVASLSPWRWCKRSEHDPGPIGFLFPQAETR